VLGVVVDHLTAQRAHTEFRNRAFALLEAMAVPCALDVALNNIERLDDTLTELVRSGRRDLHVMYVAVVDAQATGLAHSDSGTVQSSMTRIAGTEAVDFPDTAASATRPAWRYVGGNGGYDVLLASMPVVSGLRWGTLVAAFDTTPVRARIDWSRTVVLIAGLLIGAALITAIWLGMLRLIIRPLHRLGQTVRDMRGGDLGARTDIASRDEIGQLAAGFDAMAVELESYTRDLEHRVAERTAESLRRQDALEEVNRRLASAVSELAVLARTDGLTGLHNRRHFIELFAIELRRAMRRGGTLVVALIDVDNFKRVNDTFGHAQGDAVLKMVADAMLRTVRTTDIVARYGGEEFVVVLLDTPAAAGADVVVRICREIATQTVRTEDGRELPRVTVSAGFVAFPDDGPGDAKTLLRCADEALYAAKAAGRNRVMRWLPNAA
jgi:diguanylate cyclase (GGDEF)-like protein